MPAAPGDLPLGQDLTYQPAGCTRGEPPAGFHQLRRSRVVGHGRAAFEAASAGIMRWQVQRGSGLRVEATDERTVEGAVARITLGYGRLSVVAPVRVVYVLDEPTRRGFAYGTLPGHPESGEESFVVDVRPDGAVTFTVTAFSRPASLLTRAAGPVNLLFQRLMAGRYLRVLDRHVRECQ